MSDFGTAQITVSLSERASDAAAASTDKQWPLTFAMCSAGKTAGATQDGQGKLELDGCADGQERA